jgi:translation elongation factor Ts
MTENNTLDILKNAILLEKRGKAFYRTAADQSTNSDVKVFFETMAAEEVQHVKILSDQFKAFGRDIAMHIAASAPLCVEREELDGKLIEKEREIYREQMLKEGKPEKMIDKIVDGKMEKYYSEVVLLEQPYVKDSDKTVGEFVKETIGSLGENMGIKRFARFRLGE